MNGISGGMNLQINGTAGTNNVTLMGNLAAGNLTVTGNSSSSNNTLTVQTNDSMQNWTFNGVNGGTISGINEMSGTFNFGNMQNIVGGNIANTYTLSGGSVNSITGGNGANTLVAGNTSNTWSITGNNAGSVTGVANFTQIQNLTGGAGNNAFSFSNGSTVSGAVNGGNTTGTNTLNFSAATNTVNFTLSDTHSGAATGIGGGFLNINNIVGNGKGVIAINNASKTNVIHITGPLSGYINDPTTFSGVGTLNSNAGVNTNVVFDANAVYNQSANNWTVGGSTFTFGNINNFSGSYTAGLTAGQLSAVNSAIVNSANGALSGVTDTTAQNVQVTNGVNNNLTSISDSQQNDDITITNSQKITTNCS
jgi:hypothetical protein